MGQDCAWCGTGEGICQSCMDAMFAQSAAIAASGTHLAGNLENGENEQAGQAEQPTLAQK